jgi:hypothetical protein
MLMNNHGIKEAPGVYAIFSRDVVRQRIGSNERYPVKAPGCQCTCANFLKRFYHRFRVNVLNR